MLKVEELKKKILSLVRGAMLEADELPFIEATEHITDALMAARIGDVEQITRERDELKVELRSKVDYIYEQDEIIKDYKRRAVVAEKAGRIIQRDMARVFDVNNPRICELIANIWDLAKKQAEKELAEEKKDEKLN